MATKIQNASIWSEHDFDFMLRILIETSLNAFDSFFNRLIISWISGGELEPWSFVLICFRIEHCLSL